MMMVLHNLWRRKLRTLLTILGVAIGVAAVIVLSAFGEGMAEGFGQVGASAEADLTVYQKDALLVMMGVIDAEIGPELAQIRGVDEVAGTVVGVVQLRESPYFLVAGEDPRGFAIAHYRLVEGQPLRASRQLLLGKTAAKNLKKTVGASFRIGELSYRVVGIYSTGQTFEDSGAVITLADAQRAFDRRDRVSYFKLRLRDPQQREEVKQAIEERWDDLSATRSGEPSKQDDMLELYRSFGWFLGIFAILVGGLGMMNAMLMSVFERTREIGVLRALGWRRWRVVAMILGESEALALAGGLVGMGLAFALVRLASLSAAVSGLLTDRIGAPMLGQALITALVLGAVGGIYPALRAARLAPVEAMRAESGAAVHWGRAARLLARLGGGAALRNLWRRPARTLMTALGLGIGVGFIVALLGVIAGARVIFTSLLSAGQADLIAEQANASDASFSSIDERVADRLAVLPEVRSISKMVIGSVAAPGLPYFFVFGLDPHEDYIQHYRVREGGALVAPRDILLGRLAADSLKKRVGDKLLLGGSSYRVAGIFENGVNIEDAGGVIALREAQRLFHKQHEVSFIGIGLREPGRAAAVAAELERTFPAVMFSPTADMTERMQDFASMEATFNALVALMVVVSSIVMMNVMLMSVFERTQEIGVLRACGWSQRRVLGMVMVEAIALSLISGLAGALLGLALGALLALEPTYGRLMPPTYTTAMFGQVLGLVLLLGALGGLLPAWRAARLRPIEALRYE